MIRTDWGISSTSLVRDVSTLVWVMLTGLATALAAGHGQFSLLQQSADSRTYAYTPRAVPYTLIVLEGRPHIQFQGESYQTTPGDPHLPVDVLSLGIPSGATVTGELQNPVYETISGQEIAPEPALVAEKNHESRLVFEKNQQVYLRDEFRPVQALNVSKPFRLRLQHVVTITISPYQYNPVSKTLRKVKSARIVIHFSAAGGSEPSLAAAGGAADPFFEDMYRSVLDNPSEARSWRTRDAVIRKAAQDSTRDWFETGRSYYRIPVAADGWYGIAAQDAPGLDTVTARMFYLGKPIPIVLRPDRSVEFYGLRHRGDSTYIDYYTDTSAYWLTWGGIQTGSRFAPQAAPPGPAVDTISSSPYTTHYEENTDYYEGTTQVEITQNGTVPGEGWAWEYYYPGSTYNHTFVIDRIDSMNSPIATVRIKLQSTTLHYTDPDHRAQFWVNDSLAGQQDFRGREGVLTELKVPARWLREGSNTLRIISVPTASDVNQFYLDWFEVQYQRLHVATQDLALLTIPPSAGTRTVCVKVSGFHSPSPEVYDITTNRRIPLSAVGGDSITGYSVQFSDTAGSARSYVVVSPYAATSVTNIRQKSFADIRLNGTGADYIIITHANFRSAAQRLAGHRSSFNNVRAYVVDVQDIYDEFNFGHLGTDPIKAFLHYAFQQWPGSPPSSVLMFGDASWDFHRYMSTTVKANYVPAYGVPAGDNWFVCFDPGYPFIPSMLMGRISVENPVQAEATVDKLILYDGEPPAHWNKNYMFISAGVNPTEQSGFNVTTNATIDAYISPPPIGGTVNRIFKTTPDAIDGEHMQEMRDLVKQGLSFINFLGHSGGRIWAVDIGSPYTLENTGGQLPFVTSVSCNIAGFAEPSNSVLAEDFVLAANRGAIAAWGSSSLGYANIGSTLVNLFLSGVTVDTLRGLGALTTAARIQMWQQRGSDYVSIASVNLNPLIGDPLTSYVLARRPELVLNAQDLTTNAALQARGDSVLTIRADLHNYGLVPADSVGVSLTDTYGGATRQLLANVRVRPIMHRDSLLVPWPVLKQPGVHTLTGTLDPLGLIPEVDKTNNSATINEYVFGQDLAIVRPFDNMVVPPGSQTLVVTPRQAADSAAFSYEFEVDTAATFDSPALIKSGTVPGGPVGARWTTPQLMTPGAWSWRVRSLQNSIVGQWVPATFVISAGAPALPAARWTLKSPLQFTHSTLTQASVTDSGVTLAGRPPFRILARSLGYRADINKDYYSILRMNEQTMTGLWWVQGNSFMVLRANELTGTYEFRPFNVAGDATKAAEMTAYLNSVGASETVAMTVIFDGYTNVTPTLRQAIRALGSTTIDSLLPGHSWMMISRMGSTGPRVPVLEQWSPDGIAIDSLTLDNYYTLGNGQVQSPAFSYPAAWTGLHVRGRSLAGVSTIRSALIGSRRTGARDTLATIQGDNIDLDLSSLSGRVLADSSIPIVSIAATLTTNDGVTTPILNEWSVDLQPSQELAMSPRTVDMPAAPIVKGEPLELPVTVYNIGYRTSTPSIVQILLASGTATPVMVAENPLDTIPPDGSRRVVASIPTSALSGAMTATVRVIPRPESHDLIDGNNQVRLPLTIASGVPTKIVLFADGTQLMDGDYVAVRPTLIVQLHGSAFDPTRDRAELYVDEQATGSSKISGIGDVASVTSGDPTFTPTLSDGRHTLRVVLVKGNIVGMPDTVVQQLTVNVESRLRILNLYNYPNPFQRETYFTFVLAGAQSPDEARIKIYTVAGRKIQQILVSGAQMQIGFNRVPWDGRDAEGDEIANGTYIYQVEVRAGGTSVIENQKLVRLR